MIESTKQSILFHKRTITDLKFHPDGDVFFAASKDTSASMVNMDGQIVGSFEKHEGAISILQPFGNELLTCGMDLKVLRWDVLTGATSGQYNINAVVRGIDFSNEIYFCTDNSMDCESFIGMIDSRSGKHKKLCALQIPPTKLFRQDEYIIFADISGRVNKYDIRNNKIILNSKVHQYKITSIKPSACRSFFVSSSEDLTAKIIDSDTFAQKRKFECDEPVNSAFIFPTNDIVVAAGGINARDVTTTKGKGTFDTIFFDVVTQEKVGLFRTHFGTINAIDVHPQSKYYCSGGEDGSICLIKLGDDFRNAPFTKFNK